MEKKLYYQLSDGYDVSNVVMSLDDCSNHIFCDMEGITEDDSEDRQYTIIPIWLTDEEVEMLPEAEF